MQRIIHKKKSRHLLNKNEYNKTTYVGQLKMSTSNSSTLPTVSTLRVGNSLSPGDRADQSTIQTLSTQTGLSRVTNTVPTSLPLTTSTSTTSIPYTPNMATMSVSSANPSIPTISRSTGLPTIPIMTGASATQATPTIPTMTGASSTQATPTIPTMSVASASQATPTIPTILGASSSQATPTIPSITSRQGMSISQLVPTPQPSLPTLPVTTLSTTSSLSTISSVPLGTLSTESMPSIPVISNSGQRIRQRGSRRQTSNNLITKRTGSKMSSKTSATSSATAKLEPQQLTIYSHLDSIYEYISTLSDKQMVVRAPTGSGKSLGLPWRLAQESSETRVFVAVPTITAAESLTRLQKILSPGVKVGFAAEGRINYTDDTRIIYATSGHVRRKILRSIVDGKCVDMDWATYLIIDEAHSGSIDNSVIYGLWRNCMRSDNQVPALILASATIDKSVYPKLLMYALDDPGYPVDIKYHTRTFSNDKKRMFMETANVISSYHSSQTPGHFLVFASGKSEVEAIITLLQANSVLAQETIIIPAYASLSSQELARIYEDSAERKIIVATNVAETAITISDVGLVVDTMTEKVAETSSAGGFRLNTTFISKSSAKQRCGRTGRTQEGICYRMIRESDYERLADKRKPEIVRTPIYRVVIELLSVGLDASRIIDDITPTAMVKAIEVLTNLKMVDANGYVTNKGNFVSEFPLSLRNAAILYEWIVSGKPAFPAISALTMIDSYGPSYFWYPQRNTDESNSEYKARLDAHRDKYFTKYEGYSDVETFLNVWLSLMSYADDMNRSKREINRWASKNSMNARKIWEAYNIARQSINALRRLTDINVQVAQFDPLRLIEVFRPYVLSAYSDKIFNLSGRSGSRINYTGTGINNVRHSLDSKHSVNRFMSDPPQKIAALVTAEISSGRGNFRIISVALDMYPQLPEGTSVPRSMPSGYASTSYTSSVPVPSLPISSYTSSVPVPTVPSVPLFVEQNDDDTPYSPRPVPRTPACLINRQEQTSTTSNDVPLAASILSSALNLLDDL